MTTIQELERQLLNLDRNERQRLVDFLIKSLTPAIEAPTPKMTLMDAIDEFRRNMSPEELDPDAEDFWENVRDRTPVSEEPRW